MKRILQIKGQQINGERPVICVPIVAETSEKICSQAVEFVRRNAPMVEWRLDYFEDIHEDAAVLEVLSRLKNICVNTVLLVTIRSIRQGGVSRLREKELIHLLNLLAESGCVDFLDVEFFELSNPRKVIEQIRKQGVYVITSHHDFHETPPYDVMMMLLRQMEEGGADIVKLAVMPTEEKDVLTLLSVTNDFYRQNESVPIISMSMGKMGLVSRLSGQTFGSCVTFAVMGASSAPGQPRAEELTKVLDFMEGK